MSYRVGQLLVARRYIYGDEWPNNKPMGEYWCTIRVTRPRPGHNDYLLGVWGRVVCAAHAHYDSRPYTWGFEDIRPLGGDV
jgi:hypothetical protein